MLDQLQHKRDVITLESNSGAVALESAINRLPDFFGTVKLAFNKYLGAMPSITALFSSRTVKDIAQKVSNKQYTALRSLEVYTPPGLKTDYLSYAEVLEASVKKMLTLKQEILQPFASWLGAKLGNPASLASITTNLNITGYSSHNTEKLSKDLTACFHNSGRLEVLSTYGAVIKRNGDWATIGKISEALNTAFSDVHHKEIVALVNQCTNMMDQLMLRMEEEPQTYKMSPAAIQALAAVSYDIGRELEFYGLLRHRINEFNKAVTDTAGKLDQVVE